MPIPALLLALRAVPFALTLAVQPPAPSRSFAERPRSNTAPDSVRVLKSARSAQSDFESTRRANLPLNTRGSGGRCDVRVGRFCYWWDDGEYDAPAELPKTKAARRSLLDRLAKAAALQPGDRWIAGQRVRYLIEDDRAPDAVQAARDCRAEASWCAVLEGLASHAAGDFARADSAFSAGLAAMSEKERCRWKDISLLLEGDARKRYERLACADRGAFESRFWALSRPLYLLPANDLRTEHFSRLTMAELLRMARYPHDMPWGDDSRELLVRYGWETAWSRDVPSVSSPMDVHVVGHEPTPAFDFVPDAAALSAPDSLDASDWSLHDRAAQSRYAPRYARSVANLDHQVAMFRRGDSAIVVAAFDVGRDTVFAHDSIGAALAIAPATTPDSGHVVSDSAARRHAVLTTAAPWAPLIVSVEARDSAARRFARARTIVRPPPGEGRITISDLMFFDDPHTLPRSLEDATPRARGSMRVARSAPVGVYWELYGVPPEGEPLSFTLTVTRHGESWYRRAAEKLGVVDRRAPVYLQWDEPATATTAPRSRALAVDFSTLPEGNYRVELRVESRGELAAASRSVVVTEAAR
jgi:hypothetical protein